MCSKEDRKIAVWFSCGAASAVAAKLAVSRFNHVRVLNNPIQEEHSDNQRFLRDVIDWIGQDIETVAANGYEAGSCDEVWRRKRYMAGNSGAACTLELKKRARQQWEQRNPGYEHVLGFTADEAKRHKRFVQTERDLVPLLIDEKLTKEDCIRVLMSAGIDLPVLYKQGFSNANCLGCVKATSATYWNKVRELYPEVFEQRSKLSRELGARLVRHNGQRIFLDELPVGAVGAPLSSYSLECGVFCDQYSEL